MTANKEDYLKALYKLGGKDSRVSNKQMSQALNIAPASVSEMLSKLSNDGLVVYESYKGTCLTDEGVKIARKLLRSHRLWEVFLLNHLCCSWSEAHEDAELLEHVTPLRLIDRLDEYLDFPEFCPHGNAIPHGDRELPKPTLVTLDRLKVGEHSHIRRVIEEKDLLDYLESLGLKIGYSIKIISIGEYDGPYIIELEGEKKQLSYKAASKIFVDIPTPSKK